MEKFLTSTLKCLPEVERCCFCIKNLKLASIPCSVLIFFLLFPQNQIAFLLYTVKYHHKPEVDPVSTIQAILAYSGAVLSLIAFVTNIVVFFMFCNETIPKTWGYLFVLSVLMWLILESAWCILVFIRAFFDPGLFCKEIDVTKEKMTLSKKTLYCSDMFVLGTMIFYIPMFYPLIVIYSWLRAPPYVPGDESLGSSRRSSYSSARSSRANSVAAGTVSGGVTGKTSKRNLLSNPSERDEHKNIVIDQIQRKQKTNQEKTVTSHNDVSCEFTESNELQDKSNEETGVVSKQTENSGLNDLKNDDIITVVHNDIVALPV